MGETNRRQINFRLTEKEWDWLEYQMQTNNIPLSISAYAKQQTLYGEINCLGISNDDAKIITTSLAKIGNNLNQLAKKVNSGEKMPMHLYGSVIDDVAELKKLILRLLAVKEQKKIQNLTTDEKNIKLFFKTLEKRGIARSVGVNIYFLLILCTQAKSPEEKNKIIYDMLEENNISSELAIEVYEIICKIFGEGESK